MSTRAIVSVKLSLTEGDFFTLWAPKWRQDGSEWQAFLGDDESVLAFHSEAELLSFLESGKKHDLDSHPHWNTFQRQGEDRVQPGKRDYYDLIGLPNFLAGRASHENVSQVSRCFELAESLAAVSGAERTTIFFASHSLLHNVSRGVEHYTGDNGKQEWTTVGEIVASNWAEVIEELDGQVRVVDSAEFSEEQREDAARRISDAAAATEAAKKEAAERREAEANAADPYDNSPWAAAGIDPVKITIDMKSVYTLRTYVDGQPVFLGKWGEIFTFPTSKQVLRWIMENDDHDLASVATWEDIVNAANGGELEFTVHADNRYTFNNLVNDIEQGPEHVDSEQMNSCYEVCADAADWAGDDSVNSFMLANPRFQDYLGFMLGATEQAGYVPSKPYNEHAKAWKGLEEMLVKRFSKF